MCSMWFFFLNLYCPRQTFNKNWFQYVFQQFFIFFVIRCYQLHHVCGCSHRNIPFSFTTLVYSCDPFYHCHLTSCMINTTIIGLYITKTKTQKCESYAYFLGPLALWAAVLHSDMVSSPSVLICKLSHSWLPYLPQGSISQPRSC